MEPVVDPHDSSSGTSAPHRTDISEILMPARAIAATIRSTLGPKGMDKMLVNEGGEVIVTNDGVTILREMDVDNPIARLLIEIAKSQEDEVGDGTTSAVTFAGELLAASEDLYQDGIHPSTIVRGYNLALERAHSEIEALSTEIDSDDSDQLQAVAETSMVGRGTEPHRTVLGRLVVDAISSVTVERDSGNNVVDLGLLKLETLPKGSSSSSKLIHGSAIETAPVSADMPTEVRDARILLLDQPITVDDVPVDISIDIDDSERLTEFPEGAAESERDELAAKVDQIVAAGANVVICHEEIHELAQHFLRRAGVLAVHDLSTEVYGDESTEIEFLRDVFDGRIVSTFDSISPDSLVRGSVRFVDGEEMLYVESEDANGVTLLVGGSTEQGSRELLRGVEDAVNSVAQVLRTGLILPGGGATDIEVASRLREFSSSINKRDQLAVEAFADALEKLPMTLAQNSGFDPIDTLVELRSAHANDGVEIGIDLVAGNVVDVHKQGIVEPAFVKIHSLGAAVEVANMILKIDEIIDAEDVSETVENPPDTDAETS